MRKREKRIKKIMECRKKKRVVVVASDESGNIDLQDLKAKALKHKDHLVKTSTFSFYRVDLRKKY